MSAVLSPHGARLSGWLPRCWHKRTSGFMTFATWRIMFPRGIPEAVIRQLTGHRSCELKRCEHLSPVLKRFNLTL
jgi:hypothetical protein